MDMEITPQGAQLGPVLREARKLKYGTQTAAAKDIGCDKVAISLYESGHRVPAGPRLYVICKLYGLPFTEMAQIAYATPEK